MPLPREFPKFGHYLAFYDWLMYLSGFAYNTL